jgi:hypothetical protein
MDLGDKIRFDYNAPTMKYATHLPFVQEFLALLLCEVAKAFAKAVSTLPERKRVKRQAGLHNFLRFRLVLMSELRPLWRSMSGG